MRCLVCGRAGRRGEHERDVVKLSGWLAAIVFTAGVTCGAVLTLSTAWILAAA